jgi:hypothetical protein
VHVEPTSLSIETCSPRSILQPHRRCQPMRKKFGNIRFGSKADLMQ